MNKFIRYSREPEIFYVTSNFNSQTHVKRETAY